MFRTFILGALSFASFAETFPLPPSDLDLIGSMGYTHATQEDTLLDIAKRFDLGQEEIVEANPEVDRWMPGENTMVVLPQRYILPKAPRSGAVVNIPEMRIYYYPKTRRNEVVTHPVSIGRMDWRSPLGTTRVVGKTKDPSWTPPESIKIEHAAKGDPLPDVVPPGPDNPLGAYALRLGVPGYLIHGTDKPFGIGMRVTHGCVRMYPEDIESLFADIEIGTPVVFVDQAVKLGWFADTLYVEAHPALEESQISDEQALEQTFARIESDYPLGLLNLDSDSLRNALRERRGIPVAISRKPDIENPRFEPEEDISSL
ncbi:MAG: L,D-transpeptidase family protein [Methylococcaceae bacterium]|nr:L,D-transpeptidase family protein [Methylococcaceae bacterium]MCI0733237.1 L,D-transpeptidase family protein [Methylococcaceae bacterium]